MLHPDYQYDPRLITAMAAIIASGTYDVALGSQILGNAARRDGTPLYKDVANRLLTAFENMVLGTKLSAFHTGYRAFSREVLASLPLLANSDDFGFEQPDAGAGPRIWIHDRRDLVSNEILSRGELDQFSTVSGLRLGRHPNERRLSAVALAAPTTQLCFRVADAEAREDVLRLDQLKTHHRRSGL
jgi:hypothetical protein